jgi:hypothetical protein
MVALTMVYSSEHQLGTLIRTPVEMFTVILSAKRFSEISHPSLILIFTDSRCTSNLQ